MGSCTSSLLLPATCLKPTYSLRRQLMMSYGCTALLTISVCVAVAVVCAIFAGHVVKDESRAMVEAQVLQSVKITSKYAAASMTERLTIHRGTVSLLEQILQDRIVGYPFQEFSRDQSVPFRDIDTGRNIYPLQASRAVDFYGRPTDLLRPDWNIVRNVLPANVQEHVQERYPEAVARHYRISTATASYYQQGTCNPAARIGKDGSVPYDYYPHCTTYNNNFTTGGVLRPTNTSAWISRAGADIVPLLKALWESQPTVLTMGIYFHNRGAGSTLLFPGIQANVIDEYISSGCQWMRSLNPNVPDQTIASDTEINNCHPAGDRVQGREYNPMERDWCIQQALAPNEYHYYGPYRIDNNTTNTNRNTSSAGILTSSPWAFGVGKAVYDRDTQRFIACTSVDIGLEFLHDYLQTIDQHTQAALVKMDGTVVGGAGWDPQQAQTTIHIGDTKWLSRTEWDHVTLSDENYNLLDWEQFTPIIKTHRDGSYVTVYPLLQPSSTTTTTTTTTSNLKPAFWMVFYVQADILHVFDDIDSAIDGDVSGLIRASILIGVIGAGVLLVAIWIVTRTLTQPLKWIESVAWQIVNHSSSSRNSGRDDDHHHDGEVDLLEIQNSAMYPGWNRGGKRTCAPRTNITELVSEFSRMIQGFSGVGASHVAKSTIHEVPNILRWQTDFHYLYQYRQHLTEDEGDEMSNDRRDNGRDAGSIGHSHQSHSRGGGGSVLEGRYCNVSLCSASHNSVAANSKQASNRSIRTEESIPVMRSSRVVGSGFCDSSSAKGSSILPRGSSARSSSVDDISADLEDPARHENGEGDTDRQVHSSHPSAIREDSNVAYRADDIESGEFKSAVKFDNDNVSSDGDHARRLSRSQRSKSSDSLYSHSRIAASVDELRVNDENDLNSLEGEIGSMQRAIFQIPMIAPPRINHGPNIRSSNYQHYIASSDRGTNDDEDDGSFSHRKGDSDGKVKTFRSSLFRWTLLLIVIPQVLTTICITVLVSYTIINVLPTWVQLSEEPSLSVARDTISIAATQGAVLSESILVAPLRDLYMITRLAGWLLFNAVPRSDGFTEYWHNAEECKVYGFIWQAELCPFYTDPSNVRCDCAWHDAFNLSCQNYPPEMQSRRFQEAFYAGLARDADPLTGRRNFTTPIPYEDSPGKTLWWNDTSTMPGSWKGTSASGYETTYDRVRVSSALSSTLFPVYNYMNRMNVNKYFMYAGVAFEADGMSIGYRGCDFFTNPAHWESTVANRAAQIRPELCPIGRYGYDPRCREWYDTGMKLSAEQNQQVYITPPYVSALTEEVGTTATSPLVDPVTGQHVGQTSLNFRLEQMISAVQDGTDALFTFIISPTEDESTGGDTLLGPDYTVGTTAPKAILDLILPYDSKSSDNYRAFGDIVKLMKQGESGDANFLRTNETGTEELLRVSYAPVYVRALEPIRADNMTRGVIESKNLVYSVGVVERHEKMRFPYDETEQSLDAKIKNVEIVFLVAVVLVTIACTAFTGQISLAVSTPTLILLQVVKNINAGRIDDDLPPMEGGSRESNRVYISFAKLFKIVRVSNTAFFSGNLKWAYHFVSDGLTLFRKIDDKKAIGVACNNIGNILFAMNEEFKKKGSTPENQECNLMDGICCVTAAPQHFNEAISIAAKDLEESQFLDIKADFAQQLADRHFNRAVFLLKSAGDNCASPNAREAAYGDLKKTKALDIDVREYWLHNKLLMQKSDVYFERLIRRLQGLSFLRDDENIQNLWNVRELVNEADQLLFAAWHEEMIPLFKEIDRIGRLQQLESALISLEIASGNYEEAARIAMRMVVEDEYLIDSAFVAAADAFFRFMNMDSSNAPRWSPIAVSQIKRNIREMLKTCKNSTLDTGKCVVFCVALSENFEDQELSRRIKDHCMSLYGDHCTKDDVIGLVSGRGKNEVFVDVLKPKGVAGTRNAHLLESACGMTSRVTAPEALTASIELAADSMERSDDDTFILFITDVNTSKEDIESAMVATKQNDSLTRNANFNVIIIELESSILIIDEQHPRTRSRGTQFIRASSGSSDKAFQHAATMISGNLGNAKSSQQGITMEKF